MPDLSIAFDELQQELQKALTSVEMSQQVLCILGMPEHAELLDPAVFSLRELTSGSTR